MNYTTKKVTLDTTRIKKAMKTLKGTGKNNRFTNADLADFWGYANEKTISKFFSSNYIYIDLLQRFVDKCNEGIEDYNKHIRWEYLAGKDDYKTLADLQR